jgi:serine/threonine protein kinase
VLFKLPSHHLVSETPIRRCLGPVASEKIYLANGKPPSKHSPRAVVQPASFSNLDFSQLRNIALVGFGKAFVESTPPPTLHCPTNILPPEVFFGYPPSSKSDIWQLACLFFKIHTGAYPFRTTLPYEWLVKQATEYIGPVPRHWRDRYDRDGSEARTAGLDLEEWFDKNQPTKFLDDYLCEEGHLSNVAERQDLARLLFEMLAWQPDKPPQAGMVVDYMYLIWLGR